MILRNFALLALAVISVAAARTDKPPKRTMLLRIDNVRVQDLQKAGLQTDEYSREALLSLVRDTALVLATPAEAEVLKERGFLVSVIMQDSSLITLCRRALYGPTMRMPSRYHSYPQVLAFLDSTARAHPNIARRIRIGTTSQEKRPIEGMRISSNPGQDQDKPALLFNGCHHADEVMGAEICLAIIGELTRKYSINPEVRRWVDSYETVIVPVVNVDGYTVVTDGRDPRWRKNTRDTDGNGILYGYPEGVDLNRQYDFNWAFGGSADSLSERYRGPFPFSETEVQGMRDLVLRERFLLSLTYHSQGEVVYYPWNWGGRKAPDDRLLTSIARELASSIRTMKGDSTYRAEYGAGAVGQTYTWMYGAVGTFDFVVETGLGAHIFPPEEVDRIVESNLGGVRTMFRRAEGPGIAGTVTDAKSGDRLEATVWFPEIDSQEITRRISDPLFGRWRRLLEPGRYTVIVTRPGYRPFIRRNVEVGPSGWTTLDVALNSFRAQ